MGISDHSVRSTFLMLDGKAWLSFSTLIHPKGDWVEVRTQAGQSSSSTPNSLIQCLYGPYFVHWCTVMLEQEGGIPKLLHGAWNCPTSLGMLRHSEFLSLELRGQAQLHQTLHLAQCSQTSTVLLATAKPRLVHQIARWRSAIHHSRERVSTALESSGSVLYTTASDALHCTY